MIYIQEKYFTKQIDMLHFIIEMGEFEIIIWLYPESKIKHLFGLEILTCEKFQGASVTKYDTPIIKRTIRQKATLEFIAKLKKSRRVFTQNCDSCVLYKVGEFNWYAALIGHEGMLLVNDDEKKEEFILNGFNATLEPPDYW